MHWKKKIRNGALGLSCKYGSNKSSVYSESPFHRDEKMRILELKALTDFVVRYTTEKKEAHHSMEFLIEG